MSKPQNDRNLHKNHRKRLRETAVKAGLESFENHNLLELLLFNSIPQQNTNETAHKLLKSCGGIRGVLSSDKNTILSCENVGENTALFLNTLGGVCEKYLHDIKKSENGFSSVNGAREYFYDILKAQTDSVMAVLTLDGMGRIKTQNIHKKEGVLHSELLSTAVKDALSGYSVFSLIAFTHPNGILAPDKDEINFVCSAKDAFDSVGVRLTEVLIATTSDCRFLSETDIFPKGFFDWQSGN